MLTLTHEAVVADMNNAAEMARVSTAMSPHEVTRWTEPRLTTMDDPGAPQGDILVIAWRPDHRPEMRQRIVSQAKVMEAAEALVAGRGGNSHLLVAATGKEGVLWAPSLDDTRNVGVFVVMPGHEALLWHTGVFEHAPQKFGEGVWLVRQQREAGDVTVSD